MPRKPASDNLDKICEQKEQLKKEHPGLEHSFNRFAEDWKRYATARKTGDKMSKKTSSRDRMVFGGVFKSNG